MIQLQMIKNILDLDNILIIPGFCTAKGGNPHKIKSSVSHILSL
jgi:hypothetical protein